MVRRRSYSLVFALEITARETKKKQTNINTTLYTLTPGRIYIMSNETVRDA